MKVTSIAEEAQTLIRIIGRDSLASYIQTRLGVGRDLQTRPLLVMAYAQLMPAESFTFIEKVLTDRTESLKTRVTALRAVSALVDRQALPQRNQAIDLLTACLDSPELPIRSVAATALAKINNPNSLKKLIQLYQEGRLDILAAEDVRNFAVSLHRGNELKSTGLFIGRGSCLQILSERLATSRIVIVLGIAGIGKTALLTEFSRRSDHEVKIWIPASAGMTAKQLLRELIDHLGFIDFDEEAKAFTEEGDNATDLPEVDIISSGLNERGQGRKILAIFDGIEKVPLRRSLMVACEDLASDFSNISFIFSGRCRADEFTFNDLLTLNQLDDHESLQLIDKLLRHKQLEVHHAAARLSHGHPLAIRIVAASLGRTSSLPSEKELFDQLSTGIEESLSCLNPMEIALLELIAQLDSSADLGDTGMRKVFEDQVIGFSLDVMYMLNKSGFLIRSGGNNYDIHWLLRTRFRGTIEERTRLRVNKRFSDYFLERGDLWEALLHQERGNAEIALETLLANVEALINKGHAPRACEMLSRLYEECKSRANTRVPSWRIFGALGEFRHTFAPLSDSLDAYKDAITLLDGRGSHEEIALLLNKIGRVLFELGERSRAIEMHRNAVNEAEQGNATEIVLRALSDLGRSLAVTGEVKRGLEICAEVDCKIQEISDPSVVVYCMANLARVELLNSPIKALNLYREAVSLLGLIDDLRLTASILADYGGSLTGMSRQPEDTIEVLSNSYSIAQTIHAKGIEAYALYYLGKAFANKDDTGRSVRNFDEALALADYRGDYNLEGLVLWNKSLVLDEMGRRDDAISSARLALHIMEQLGDVSVSRIRDRLKYWRA